MGIDMGSKCFSVEALTYKIHNSELQSHVDLTELMPMAYSQPLEMHRCDQSKAGPPKLVLPDQVPIP